MKLVLNCLSCGPESNDTQMTNVTPNWAGGQILKSTFVCKVGYYSVCINEGNTMMLVFVAYSVAFVAFAALEQIALKLL